MRYKIDRTHQLNGMAQHVNLNLPRRILHFVYKFCDIKLGQVINIDKKRELSDIDAALRLYRCAAPARLQRLFAARTLSYLDESASGLAKGKNTDPERLRRLDFIRQGVREKLESL